MQVLKANQAIVLIYCPEPIAILKNSSYCATGNKKIQDIVLVANKTLRYIAISVTRQNVDRN